MKHILCLLMLLPMTVMAQKVKVTWANADANSVISGDANYTGMVTADYSMGVNLTVTGTLANTGAEEGFSAVTFDPVFTKYRPKAQVSAKSSGHNVAFKVTPATGHKFKPTKISFDASRVSTDGGNVIVCTKLSGGTEKDIDVVTPLRNKISASNSTGYSSHSYFVNDYNSETAFLVLLYIENVSTEKDLALRNVVIEGEIDTEISTASNYITSLTYKGNIGGGTEDLDLYSLVSNLKNGETARYSKKHYGNPSYFVATLKNDLAAGYTVSTSYDESTHKLTVEIKNDNETEFLFYVTFSVTNQEPKGKATPLKRGLMAANLSLSGGKGNLVSWRSRKTDSRNYKFKIYRGMSEGDTSTPLNNGKYISGKTNFADTGGSTTSYYKLEVYDDNDNMVETDVCKAWSSQVNYIDLEGGAPTDIWNRGATYTPNDASFCDVDGDGEYEIILKWSPSNEKDSGSSGTTSPEYFACYEMDGKRKWILTGGPNMFSSAHTSSFVAWDLDGDGFGEFMIKTGHGAIDGEGNYLSVDNDPTGNYLNGRGKQVTGEEWITVFDATTGAELQTIPYHTDYAAGSSYWGDSNQNRSERYLAGIAWLDGEDENPSAVFSRGYYSGAFIGAYDWDGANLTLRWVHRAFAKNNGEVEYADGRKTQLTSTVYGEGCHWFSSADVDRDGTQEITFGSGALKSDGTTLYRTGLGHGDALHVSDFDPSRPGLEVFMVHEKGNYGIDYRDGTTGEILLRKTASSDTGRGLMANFDPERDDALWQASEWPNIFDKDGNSVIDSKTWGGGAAPQDRLYWTGTLGDDFWGKGILETWNAKTSNFDRLLKCVNNSNYTIGTTNNSSKNNACLLGDLLGDWREEVVLWTTGGTTGYQLVINATNHLTDYIVPHLMDDIDYRAQLISENCCYNQPPHLGYNLRESKKIAATTFEVEPSTEAGENLGRYWGSLYTTYPVKVPEGVTVFSVNDYNYTSGNTLTVTTIGAGSIIGANKPIVFNSTVANPVFVPTTLDATANPSTEFVNGNYNSEVVTVDNAYSAYRYVYEFRNGDHGVGFYKTDGTWNVPGGEAYAIFGYSSNEPGADSYVLPKEFNPSYDSEAAAVAFEYFNDFENVEGTTATGTSTAGETAALTQATITGNGSFDAETYADSNFGTVFQNAGGSMRTNYLKLPADVLSHSADSKQLTIGVWVNKSNATDYDWAPLFTAYGAAPSNGANTSPMMACQTRGILQVNCGGWCDYIDAQNTAGSNGVYQGDNDWLSDGAWHYYTVVFKNQNAKVYFDGELKNEWDASQNDSRGTTTQLGLFSNGNQLSYICLGGNQAWDFKDNDPAFAFDDLFITSRALTEDDIKSIISDKLVDPNLTFSAQTASLLLGQNKTITPTSDSPGAITYSSSDTNVATVDASTGELTAVAEGTCVITATQQASGSYHAATASYTLNVSFPWDKLFSTDFSTAPTGITYSVTSSTTDINNGYLHFDQGGGSGDRALNFSFGDLFNVSTSWLLEFDWAASSANTNGSSQTFATDQGNCFSISWASYASTATLTDASSNNLTTELPIEGYKSPTMSKTSHFKVSGVLGEGIYLTVTQGNQKYIDNVLVTSTFGYPKSFNGTLGRAVSHVMMDNIDFYVERDVNSCANPTYSLGAFGTSRTFTLDCPTPDVEIYYSETELTSATGGSLYTDEVTTSAATIWAYAKLDEITSEVISFETGAGAEIKLNAPTFKNADYQDGVYTVRIDCDQTSLEIVPTAVEYYYSIDGGAPVSFTSGATVDVNVGSTIIAYATAEGYDASDEASLTPEPMPVLQSEWIIDFREIEATDYSDEKIGNYYKLTDGTNIINENFGVAGKENDGKNRFYIYDNGLYSYYSGNRNIAIQAEAGQYVRIITNSSISSVSGMTHLTTLSTGNMHIFTVNNTGINTVSIGRNTYIYSVEVLNHIPTATKTISSAGWATYCSPYALDFSEPIENLTEAYYVTGLEANGTTLQLDPISGLVPPETGVLLKGQGECLIPVYDNCAQTETGNKLVGVLQQEQKDAATIYVLMNETSGVGFYKNNKAFTVGAQTAYLPADFAEANSRAFLSFDDTATGIREVKDSDAETRYYNLQGQRVNGQLRKGLYIVNGKKRIVK